MEKKEKETKKKMTYLERYEQDKERWRQIRKSPRFYYVCLLPLFYVVTFFISMEIMGEQALMYSNDVYDDIKVVMENSLIKDYGIDTKILQNGFDLVEKETGHVDHYEGVDSYIDNYSKGKHTLEATIKNGYFEATIVADLDENFQVKDDSKRNFESAREYMEKFRSDLAWFTFVYATTVWVAIGVVWHFLREGIVDVLKYRQKKKEEAEVAETESKKEEVKESSEKTTQETAEKKEEPKAEEPAEPVKEAEKITEFPKEAISL